MPLTSISKGKQSNDFNAPSTTKILLWFCLVFLYFYGWVKPCYISLSRFWFFRFVVGIFQINIVTRLSASSYSTFAVLKIWLEEYSDSLSEMEFSNCVMICGGCFDDEWM